MVRRPMVRCRVAACCTSAQLLASSAAAAWAHARIEAGKGARLHREGRQRGPLVGATAGAELLCSCRAWEEGGEGRKGRREKKKREKEKKKKGKGKRKMERERKRERAIGGIRGGGRRTRTAASVGSNSHVERGKEEHKDGD